MLRPFRVVAPTHLSEAVAELGQLGDRARLYAGGAELLLLMRHGLVEADYLLDVKGLPELNGVTHGDGSLRIGATTTHRQLELDPLVREHTPILADAEAEVGNIRVRCQGTLGGNLCFADPHSDPPTALLVYEATVTLQGQRGSRQMPLAEFLVSTYETALDADEILTEVRIPPLPTGWGQAFQRIERFYRPTANVAATVKMADGHIEAARFAVGCVGPKAMRLSELERQLRGLTLPEAQRAIEASGDRLRAQLDPVDDLLGSSEYKIAIVSALLRRALMAAARHSGATDGA